MVDNAGRWPGSKGARPRRVPSRSTAARSRSSRGTTALHVGDDERGGLHIRSRPLHVEVLDEDGKRQVVSIRDVERILLVAITIGTLASTYVLRAMRKNRKRRYP